MSNWLIDNWEVIILRGSVHAGISGIAIYLMQPPLNTETAIFTVSAIIGSYLPDCDIFVAPAGKVIPLWLFTKHRQHTHSLVSWIIVSGIAYLFDRYVGMGIGLGYGLHLVFDGITPMGLPYLLWPFRRKKRA